MKKCPFCGSDYVGFSYGKHPDGYDLSFISCDGCGAHGPARRYADEWDDDESAAAWNKRYSQVSESLKSCRKHQIKSALTPIQEQALILADKCFGSVSDEFLAFCKYLVTVEQGLPWDDGSIPDCAWIQSRAEGRPIPPDVEDRLAKSALADLQA